MKGSRQYAAKLVLRRKSTTETGAPDSANPRASGCDRTVSVRGEANEDVLMLLANVRGGINSLLAATLTAHLQQVLLSEQKEPASSRELTETLIDLVHAYFK